MTVKLGTSCSFRLSEIWTVPSAEQLFSSKAPECSSQSAQQSGWISHIKSSSRKMLPTTWSDPSTHPHSPRSTTKKLSEATEKVEIVAADHFPIKRGCGGPSSGAAGDLRCNPCSTGVSPLFPDPSRKSTEKQRKGRKKVKVRKKSRKEGLTCVLLSPEAAGNAGRL